MIFGGFESFQGHLKARPRGEMPRAAKYETAAIAAPAIMSLR